MEKYIVMNFKYFFLFYFISSTGTLVEAKTQYGRAREQERDYEIVTLAIFFTRQITEEPVTQLTRPICLFSKFPLCVYSISERRWLEATRYLQ